MTGPALDPEVLSTRDWRILRDLQRLRLLSGLQLERLRFSDLATPNTRGSARRRTMNRLTLHQLVTTLPRRVGGERAGSAGLIYALDGAGHRLLDVFDGSDARRRRPWAIGQLFVQHTLAVSELYVRLREAERRKEPDQGLRLLEYHAEPQSWHHGPLGWLKPDAYAVLVNGRWEEHCWLEVDRGTESLPTLRRKLLGYLDSATAGDLGPRGVLPRVLVTVETAKRYAAVADLIERLPPPAAQMLSVELFEQAFREPLSAPDNRGPP